MQGTIASPTPGNSSALDLLNIVTKVSAIRMHEGFRYCFVVILRVYEKPSE
jgi:hypothetical protein